MASEKRLNGTWKLLTGNFQAKLGLTIVVVFLLVATVEAIAGWGILMYDPVKINPGEAYLPPSLSHLFGTTNLGQDIFSQIIAGAPNDVLISFVVVSFACCVGGVLGSTAGYAGGIIDDLLMRVTDIFFADPFNSACSRYLSYTGSKPCERYACTHCNLVATICASG